MYLQLLARGGGDAVRDVGHGGDDVHVELAVETLLDDLHVQQSEESAAEAEAERQRALRFEGQRGVVELQLFERGAQILVLVGYDGIDACEDHGLDVLEAGDRLAAGARHRRDGIADLHLGRVLDARTDVAHVARADLVARRHFEFEHPHLVGVVFSAGVDEFDVLALADRAVEDTEIGDDTPEGVEYRVENERLQRGVVVALRCGDAGDDGFEYLLDALARFARSEQNVFALATDQVDHLVGHLVDHRRVDVDLVEYGDDFQIVPDGQIEVRNRLCLDALRGVDHQQRPFARGDRARHLVGEVDVSRRVDQVEHVPLAVARGVFHLDGVALDGDALLAFEVHVVEYLRLHLALVQGVGFFQQPVGQRAFAVVDVGDDAKIAYVLHVNPLVLSLPLRGVRAGSRNRVYRFGRGRRCGRFIHDKDTIRI